MSVETLVTQLKSGLDAPICLTWELTYACNLQCVHCLSSSGQRDPRELTTAEAKQVLDELRDLQVFYINIGGGEPMVRRDFFELLEYSIANGIGVKFSTNGAFIDAEKARRLAAMDYLDIQISLDGIDAVTNDAVRGPGSYEMALRAMDNLAAANFGPFKISVVVTRHNVDQLDEFKAGSVRNEGGFSHVWKQSPLFLELREPQSAGACSSCGSYDACQGGCMAAKFFTGLPLDGPDPECVTGHGDQALQGVNAALNPKPAMDHSKPVSVSLSASRKLSVVS